MSVPPTELVWLYSRFHNVAYCNELKGLARTRIHNSSGELIRDIWLGRGPPSTSLPTHPFSESMGPAHKRDVTYALGPSPCHNPPNVVPPTQTNHESMGLAYKRDMFNTSVPSPSLSNHTNNKLECWTLTITPYVYSGLAITTMRFLPCLANYFFTEGNSLKQLIFLYFAHGGLFEFF